MNPNSRAEKAAVQTRFVSLAAKLGNIRSAAPLAASAVEVTLEELQELARETGVALGPNDDLLRRTFRAVVGESAQPEDRP